MNFRSGSLDARSNPPPVVLTDALRGSTRALHQKAERTGIVSDILHGRASRAGYALLLRCLLPVYEALEDGLARQRPNLAAIAREEAFRSTAIRSDLSALVGPGWQSDLPVLAAAREYCDRIGQVANDSARLLGHAYVRYFGDLNGGQILKRLLGRSLGLPPEALTFYDFPAVTDLALFKRDYRDAFDRAIVEPRAIAEAAEEAAEAFRLNINVSEAVRAASAGPSSQSDCVRP